jgi:hypothetical protein
VKLAATPAAGAAQVAAARGTAPERLRRQLAGDLDTVVLKALAPAPERRYASATELIDDRRRYRTGHPVRARPDSRAYLARAFVRRNRWEVAAAGLFALPAGTAAVTTVQQRRTARAQARTARALARATAEAAKAREVTRFVTSLLQEVDPYGAPPRRPRIRPGPRASWSGSGRRASSGSSRVSPPFASSCCARWACWSGTCGTSRRPTPCSIARLASADTSSVPAPAPTPG